MRRAIVILVAVLATSVAGGLLDGIVWPGTALALFRPQLTLVLLVATVVALALGPRWVGIAGLGLAVLGVALLVPALTDPRPEPPIDDRPVVRVLALNLWARNDDVDAVSRLIERERPDVVALSELTPAWARALAPVLREHRVRATAPGPGTSGIGLYGRGPLRGAVVVRVPRGGRHALEGRIALPDGRTAWLLVTHPPSALLPGDQGAHEEALSAIGGWARAHGSSAVVCGDLNAPAWTRSLRRALAAGDLRALLPGGLVAGSWPALPPPLRISIDGCLVGRGVRARAELGPRVGSDHLPVLVELA